MGWLSVHEPQLRIMIETYKRQDGEDLGAKKVGEGSGENEGKIGDISEPPKTHHKNAFVRKPNHLRNRLDTTPAPPVFPPQTDNFQKPEKLFLTNAYDTKCMQSKIQGCLYIKLHMPCKMQEMHKGKLYICYKEELPHTQLKRSNTHQVPPANE
jgi:hypothetical protein